MHSLRFGVAVAGPKESHAPLTPVCRKPPPRQVGTTLPVSPQYAPLERGRRLPTQRQADSAAACVVMSGGARGCVCR